MASLSDFCEEINHDCLKDFQRIGKGAFGTIHRARHQNWGIDVAVKVLHSDTTCTREELLNEARAMDKGRFNYVVRLFGLYVRKVPAATKAGSLGGTVPSLGLVMEFIENGSLANLRSRVPSVPWALKLRVLHEVALGMNFLHGLKPPLLHLDLKPSNVLLDGELHVKVADFGLSKFKRGTSQLSLGHKEGDGYGGTLEYMPPEAFMDVNYKPTTGTDVYSYGILMWSLLTGKEPYPDTPRSHLSILIKMHIPKGQRPCTKELEKRIPEVRKLEEMIKLMKCCWHNEKTQRPSFLGCSQEIEDAYSFYKQEILDAVREVQDILLRMDSSPATERSSSSLASPVSCRSKCSPSHSANSSTGIEEHFETIRVQESPIKQTEAVPIKPFSSFKSKWKLPPHQVQRSSSMCFGKDTSEPHNGIHPHPEANVPSLTRPREKKPSRPFSDIYPFSAFPPYHPAFSNTPQSFYGYSHGDGGLTPGHPRSQQGRGIHIHGQGIQGIQIGDGNFMRIEQASGPNTQKKE